MGVPQLGKDPNRIPLAQAQKGLCDGEADRFICAGTGTHAVGILCRRSLPHGPTGMPRLPRGGQRGESASADQTTLPQPVRNNATGRHDEGRHHVHEPPSARTGSSIRTICCCAGTSKATHGMQQLSQLRTRSLCQTPECTAVHTNTVHTLPPHGYADVACAFTSSQTSSPRSSSSTTLWWEAE